MDERIDILEREVSAIKADIAVIKSTYWTREDARMLDARLSHIEADIADLRAEVAVLKSDVAQLKIDVAQLKAEVAQLKAEVAQLRVDLEKFTGGMAKMEARLKSWMLNLALTLIAVMSGIQFALYTALTP